jgi:hypothetical protein
MFTKSIEYGMIDTNVNSEITDRRDIATPAGVARKA